MLSDIGEHANVRPLLPARHHLGMRLPVRPEEDYWHEMHWWKMQDFGSHIYHRSLSYSEAAARIAHAVKALAVDRQHLWLTQMLSWNLRMDFGRPLGPRIHPKCVAWMPRGHYFVEVSENHKWQQK